MAEAAEVVAVFGEDEEEVVIVADEVRISSEY